MAIVETSSPMERLATDILGELPETENGNRYILVVSDYYTKWTESFPMPNMEASTVVKIIVEEIIVVYRFDVCCLIFAESRWQKQKITTRRKVHCKCGFFPTSFECKDERDKHLTSCANERLFCTEGGCFNHTDKSKNLLRHMKSKHQKDDDSENDKEESTSKSKDLLSDSSESESEDDWKSLYPGDILGQDSDESERSEQEEKNDTGLKESENKKDDDMVTSKLVELTVVCNK
ncbi:Hypothetical predicted protein [Mytilus galloprovincialis]|uniref:Integrase catalytic domain-containing protein n=1 Tax=Mytilus galloprovincialis TaxID=29158 RepID=A0A8B6HLL0_MYTGA|nr:Hypothetical predicted protein [Mytilus galloprovincialis]